MPTSLPAAVVAIAAGASLALVGVLRLGRIGLRSMPAWVAVGATASGVAAVAFGVAARPWTIAPQPVRSVELVPAATAAPPPPSVGVVSGTVTVAPGEPLGGAPVVLRRFERTSEAASAEARTGPDGSFRFEALPIGPTVAYTVSTDYEGTTFKSKLLFPGLREDEVVAPLVVAKTTDDPKVVEYAVDSTIVVGDRTGTQVVHIVRVRNTGDRAYVGGIRLPLAPGAAELDPREGLDRTMLRVFDSDLLSMAPVLPGETEIVYDYAAPLPRDGLPFEREITHPTTRMTLLLSPNLAARTSGLREDGEVRVGSDDAARTYRGFSARNLGAGDRVAATVAQPPENQVLRGALVGAAVALAAGVVAFPLVRRRRRPEPQE